jgi:hypothetical protein
MQWQLLRCSIDEVNQAIESADLIDSKQVGTS